MGNVDRLVQELLDQVHKQADQLADATDASKKQYFTIKDKLEVERKAIEEKEHMAKFLDQLQSILEELQRNRVRLLKLTIFFH